MRTYALSHAELCTVLAALRFYQGEGMGEPAKRSGEIHEIATDSGVVLSSLDGEAIDELCERLNLQQSSQEPVAALVRAAANCSRWITDYVTDDTGGREVELRELTAALAAFPAAPLDDQK